jgi:hypothetical protein
MVKGVLTQRKKIGNIGSQRVQASDHFPYQSPQGLIQGIFHRYLHRHSRGG